jgi:hypothetical protein
MSGCCRGLSARDCAARPNGCDDEPARVFPRETHLKVIGREALAARGALVRLINTVIETAAQQGVPLPIIKTELEHAAKRCNTSN